MNTTSTTASAAPAAPVAATVAGSSYGWPSPRWPGHRLALSGGPVACHCPASRLGHRVMAAGLEEAAEQAEQYAAAGVAA